MRTQEVISMDIVIVVFLFITAITLGPLFIIFGYLHMRRRSVNKQELQDIRNDIRQIKAEIEELKVQIADFIIKTH
jgi:cell division protein FtsL